MPQISLGDRPFCVRSSSPLLTGTFYALSKNFTQCRIVSVFVDVVDTHMPNLFISRLS